MMSKSFLTASKAQYSLSLPYLSSLMFNNPPFNPHAISWSNTDILGPLLCHAPSYHPISLISAALSLSYQPLHLANFHSTLRTRTRTTSFSAVPPASNKLPETQKIKNNQPMNEYTRILGNNSNGPQGERRQLRKKSSQISESSHLHVIP